LTQGEMIVTVISSKFHQTIRPVLQAAKGGVARHLFRV